LGRRAVEADDDAKLRFRLGRGDSERHGGDTNQYTQAFAHFSYLVDSLFFNLLISSSDGFESGPHRQLFSDKFHTNSATIDPGAPVSIAIWN
jgi:hypothetical protein